MYNILNMGTTKMGGHQPHSIFKPASSVIDLVVTVLMITEAHLLQEVFSAKKLRSSVPTYSKCPYKYTPVPLRG
jgi:hypothetical protein